MSEATNYFWSHLCDHQLLKCLLVLLGLPHWNSVACLLIATLHTRHFLIRFSDPNAALEWQARILGWRSWALTVACPLEGLVRRATSLEENSSEFSYEAKLCKLRAFCELSIESRDRSNY
jgi:hypothetical protein